MISRKDRNRLRELAIENLYLANMPSNREKETQWYRHHSFEAGRPMIHIELETFIHEFMPDRLQCSSNKARKIEYTLIEDRLNSELFNDDRVVRDFFPIAWDTQFKPFDIDVNLTHAKSKEGSDLGHHFTTAITNLKEDVHRLKPSTFFVDIEGSLAYKNLVEETIGDIMPVRLTGRSIEAVPTQDLVHLMPMADLFMAMYDSPDALKLAMDRLTDDYIRYFKYLEDQELILKTTGNSLLNQGSFCFNNLLPNDDNPKKLSQVWGFMDSQETVGINPDMYGEFIFPYYKKVADLFGLLTYGCCEPVDPIYDQYLSQLGNLKKLSISPWCDEAFMGDRLRNKEIVYHRKPSPNYIGVDKVLNEDAVRKHIRKTVDAAKGCQLEFAQRDVYTVHGDAEKVRRYVEIIREETTR